MAGQSGLFRRDVKQGEQNNFLFLQMACLVGYLVVSRVFCLFAWFFLETMFDCK